MWYIWENLDEYKWELNKYRIFCFNAFGFSASSIFDITIFGPQNIENINLEIYFHIGNTTFRIYKFDCF